MMYLLNELKKRLKPRDYRIAKLRTIHRMTQADIGKRVRLSQQRVNQILAMCRRISKSIMVQFRELTTTKISRA